MTTKYVFRTVQDEVLRFFATEAEKLIVEKLVAAGRNDTGNLIGSVRVDDSEINQGVIRVVVGGVGAPYAMAVEEGTGLYGPQRRPIEAKHRTAKGDKGFLKFKKKTPKGASGTENISPNIVFEKEGFIYAQKVRGMRGVHYARDTIESMNQRKDVLLRQAKRNFELKRKGV